MKLSLPILIAGFLPLVGCNNSQRTSSFGHGSLRLVNAPQAFAGWEDNKMRFVVIPTFDWVAGNEVRAGSDGDTTTGGKGREWWGRVNQENGDHWDFRIGRKFARFGDNEFELSEGEVFVLEKGFRVAQIKGSNAGPVNDEENESRLSQMLEDYKSEQAGSYDGG